MAQVWPQASIVDARGNSTVCFAAVPICPEPLFSSAEDISVQPQTVAYTIASKARWSDGVPVTAEDFIDLWHEVVAHAATLPVTEPIAGYLDIASITPSGRDSKITVVFKQPYADWPALFDFVPPAHISHKDGFDAAYASGKLSMIPSAGPYRISRIVPNKMIVLDRNEKFWGTKASVKRIIFRVVKSEAAILAGLTRGSITLAELPPGPAVDAVVSTSTDLVEQSASAPVLWQLAFNVAHASLTPAVVRQAIAKIVNRHELIANTVGLSTPFGQVSGNRLFPAGAPGSQGNDAAYGAVAPAEASALLASAGDRVDDHGFIHTPDGARLVLSLSIPREVPAMSGIASVLQAELLTAGIGVQIHSVSMAKLLTATLPSGSYDMALVPYPVSPYPSTMASLYLDPIGPTPPVGVDPTASAPVGVSGSVPSTTSNSVTTVPAAGSGSSPAISILPPGARGTEPGALAIGTATRDVLGFSDPVLKGLFAQASTQLNTASELSLYD
ncbi:MAG TPA: ABC transporter substrate-binding protein, partial [Acidimicrobiales bacterium]|nr:ABC transporter substrate-binding protein [Acidimicrobiales bacterium]